MKPQLTLGVIGHVDHGKTSLVRALTGIETDRLKEEKERGLSIVLGFSYMQGARAAIDLIDVPGHENFVRTMVSGAAGMDGALLVVAANEAIMPQTREHVAIAHLLGVDRGVVVITKRDLVSEIELKHTIQEVRSFTAGTFLENAEVVSTSTTEIQGMRELGQAIDKIKPIDRRNSKKAFPFLPIDRAFTMPGFGVVVTGTLRGGDLTTRSNVELLPSKRAATIRGLQVHNRPVDRATPGQRVAVNVRQVKREDISRGDVLVLQGRIDATNRVDVELRLLNSQNEPLKNGATVEFLAGTTSVTSRVRLLDPKTLEPGATGFAQLRFPRSVATYQMQRFIIRTGSPIRTIGGGTVLDANPEVHRRFGAATKSRLETIAHGSTVEKTQMYLAEADVSGTTLDGLSDLLCLDTDDVNAALAFIDPVLTNSGTLIDQSIYARLVQAILTELSRYHQEHPRHSGITAAKLLTNLEEEPTQGVYQHAIDQLLLQARIENHGGVLRLAGFDPWAGLSQIEHRLVAEMENEFRKRGLTPTYVHQIEGDDTVRRDVFQLLCETNRLVRIKAYVAKSDIVVHTENFDNAVAMIEANFTFPQKFTVSEVRELIGSNRKFTVPFLEHLDTVGVTIRMGNQRQLRTRNEQ